MKIPVFLLLFVLSLNSCNSDCGDLLYSTGPPILFIELINESDENIFTSSLYQVEDILIVNENDENIQFDFIDENNYNLIQLLPYSYTSTNIYFIKVGNVINVKLLFDVEKTSSECSTNYFIYNIKVENNEFEMNNSTGILKIKV